MIQRPPACKRHAAELPGRAHVVAPEECPFCWADQRAALSGKVIHHIDGDPDNNDPENLELRLQDGAPRRIHTRQDGDPGRIGVEPAHDAKDRQRWEQMTLSERQRWSDSHDQS